uniref:Uncharacterized protein n=1 Tax=Arundo donax TaxID=35708 RepID=A0A0A9C3S1_ARUDO
MDPCRWESEQEVTARASYTTGSSDRAKWTRTGLGVG